MSNIINITNEDFLKSVFYKLPEGAAATVCFFPGDPRDTTGKRQYKWASKDWPRPGYDPQFFRADNNNYAAVSSFYPDSTGKVRRKKEQFAGMHAVMIDDVGTKISLDKTILNPSFRIETSPGNHQDWLILEQSPDNNDRLICERLIEGIVGVAAEGVDPGMMGVTRLGRLPVGINGKPDYLDHNGNPPRCRVVICDPSRRYEIRQIADAYKINLAKDPVKKGNPCNSAKVISLPTTATQETIQHGDSNQSDYSDLVNFLTDNNMVLSEGKDGNLTVKCPWFEEHSNGDISGSMLFAPSKENNFKGGYKCHHGHCQTRAIKQVFEYAKSQDKWPVRDQVTINDFYAHLPTQSFIFTPSNDMWPARSVDIKLGKIADQEEMINSSAYLYKYRAVEQMVWAPGETQLIKNRLIVNGGWRPKGNVNVFNQYIPPVIDTTGVAAFAGTWLKHLQLIYPNDHQHIIRWCAHRVQYPGVKINHALLLGGPPRIGKDTLLEPVKIAVGPWNFNEVSPQKILDPFNGHVKSVILRVNEARDLGDMTRYAFYDHMKTYIAAPPDVLSCNEKHIREYPVVNVCGIIITTNYKTDGIYLPPDDQRHYVAWTDIERSKIPEDHFRKLWDWYYNKNGMAHVAAYLREYDLSGFDCKAPPPLTKAFYEIVDANRAPEDSELATILDALNWPSAITISMLHKKAQSKNETFEFGSWLVDRKNRRAIPHRLEKVGYVPVSNDSAADRLWAVDGVRQRVYANKQLSVSEQITAANKICQGNSR